MPPPLFVIPHFGGKHEKEGQKFGQSRWSEGESALGAGVWFDGALVHYSLGDQPQPFEVAQLRYWFDFHGSFIYIQIVNEVA